MTGKAKTYAETVTQSRRAVAAAVLADPDGHFPYKVDHAMGLVEENPPAGPGGPDDESVRVEDFLTRRIAEASADMIEAQAAYLTDPNPRTAAVYKSAQEDLVAARRSHRRNRVDGDGNPVGAIVGLRHDGATPPPHQVGPRARRAGEE